MQKFLLLSTDRACKSGMENVANKRVGNVVRVPTELPILHAAVAGWEVSSLILCALYWESFFSFLSFAPCSVSAVSRSLDLELVSVDAARVVRHHLHRVRTALARGGDIAATSTAVAANLEANFVFLHPAAAADKDSGCYRYLLAVTEKVLDHFGVARALPNAMASECLAQVLCSAVFLRLVGAVSDPDYLRGLARPCILGAGGGRGHMPNSSSDVVDNDLDPVPEETNPDAPDGSARKGPGGRPPTQDVTASAGGAAMKQSKSSGSLQTLPNGLTGIGSARQAKELAEPQRGLSSALVVSPPTAAASPGPGRISSALSGLFSSTAGPLLPENIAFKSFNKMWRSQSSEDIRREAAGQVPLQGSPPAETPPPVRGSTFRMFGRSSGHNHNHSGYSSIPTHPVDSPGQISPSRRGQRSSNSSNNNTKILPDFLRMGKKIMRKLPSFEDSNDPSVDNGSYHSTAEVSMSSGEVAPTSVPGGTLLAEEELSPRYEDSSDLETTISKLRALLSEKETTEEKQEEEGDEDSGGNRKESSSSSSSNSSSRVMALRASDMPSDGRLILNVRVPGVEVIRFSSSSSSFRTSHQASGGSDVPGNGGNGGTSAPVGPFQDGYPVYRIRYEGIYLEQMPSSNPGAGSRFRYVLQPRLVCRRFKEFLNLQVSLESNPKLRGVARGIKGPNKLLSMPFAKQSGTGMEARRYMYCTLYIVALNMRHDLNYELSDKNYFRLVLNQWLQEVCLRSQLVASQEFKDFLAYSDDGLAAFNQRGGGNKMEKLSRTVTGVITSIKDVLPNFDDDIDGNADDVATGEPSADTAAAMANGPPPMVAAGPSINMPAILVPDRNLLSPSTLPGGGGPASLPLGPPGANPTTDGSSSKQSSSSPFSSAGGGGGALSSIGIFSRMRTNSPVSR